jgi:prolipoprotein diacylglyceryl transferase
VNIAWWSHALASIPSPDTSTISLGPLTLRAYGLSIAIGVIVAVVWSSKRWEARGGNPDDISTIALWAVPAGVIGARMYHVATDWKKYQDDWGAAFNITQGGLGIPGGVALGVLVGYLVVRYKKLPAAQLLDVVAPAIPTAQAIGRLGNWFNQELFGRPTELPWGLEIAPEFRPTGYEAFETFHPTFLYEALWNLGVVALLLWIERKKRLRPGELFGFYVIGYAVGRFWVESMRIDEASLILGIRVNLWMSVIIALGAIAWMAIRRSRHPEDAALVGSYPVLVAPGAVADAAADEGAAPVADGADADAGEPANDPDDPDERDSGEAEVRSVASEDADEADAEDGSAGV